MYDFAYGILGATLAVSLGVVGMFTQPDPFSIITFLATAGTGIGIGVGAGLYAFKIKNAKADIEVQRMMEQANEHSLTFELNSLRSDYESLYKDFHEYKQEAEEERRFCDELRKVVTETSIGELIAINRVKRQAEENKAINPPA